MSENTKGSRKALRKHQAHWKDNTVTKRQNKRREQLNQKAIAAGWQSWSAYETAVINGETRLTPRAADAAIRRCPECHALLEETSVYCDNCGTDTPRR